MERIKSFLYNCIRVRTVSNDARILKGGRSDPDKPKLVFKNNDYVQYLDSSFFYLELEILNGYAIKDISISEEEKKAEEGEEMIFRADRNREYIQLGERELRYVFREFRAQTTYSELGYLDLEPFLEKKFEPGKWYKILIELENDSSRYNPYVLNFGFYPEKFLQKIESLISRP